MAGPKGLQAGEFSSSNSGLQALTVSTAPAPADSEDDLLIPSWVKLEVWKRDQGRCRVCGTTSGHHFDHIIPYSKGGSSKNPANIQILCGRHNLAEGDNIEYYAERAVYHIIGSCSYLPRFCSTPKWLSSEARREYPEARP